MKGLEGKHQYLLDLLGKIIWRSEWAAKGFASYGEVKLFVGFSTIAACGLYLKLLDWNFPLILGF